MSCSLLSFCGRPPEDTSLHFSRLGTRWIPRMNERMRCTLSFLIHWRSLRDWEIERERPPELSTQEHSRHCIDASLVSWVSTDTRGRCSSCSLASIVLWTHSKFYPKPPVAWLFSWGRTKGFKALRVDFERGLTLSLRFRMMTSISASIDRENVLCISCKESRSNSRKWMNWAKRSSFDKETRRTTTTSRKKG